MSKNQPKHIENIEVVGPGALLSEARKKQNLSIDYVASKLNFRAVLVQNIEADVYDKTLPDTYNRGYLKNYAKLVGIPVENIIDSYEKLNLFQEKSAKMQSFSRGTSKKAQNNILMWITYLIIASFIGVTMMWWLQESKVKTPNGVTNQAETSNEVVEEKIETKPTTENVNTVSQATETDQPLALEVSAVGAVNATQPLNNDLNEVNTPVVPVTVESVFTFSGDCWVNIYDAAGERIAWGIKKAGYIMTISGKAPLNITVGKPELVEIKFNGADVDMSSFRTGHISKFTLPLTPDSIKKN